MTETVCAVIFDLDGLMLDTERIAAASWKRAGEQFGFPISDEVVLEMIGRTGEDSDCVLRGAFGPEFPLEEIKNLRLTLTDEHITTLGIHVKPGLLDLLDFLDERQIKKAVATSSTRERASMKLRRTELHTRFSLVVSGDDVQRGKPAPDIYLLTATRLGVLPEQCLVLEDSDAGVRAAQAAGMKVIVIPDLKLPSPDVARLALRVEQSLSDVLRVMPDLI